MPFEWLDNFHSEMEKPADYAEKTLAAYRLGMKANGSIVGVRIQVAGESCQAAKNLVAGQVYHPDSVPYLPLSNCEQGVRCQCVYRPVMSYERPDEQD